jgi:transcriptional regulator with XRE-family HTH domain
MERKTVKSFNHFRARVEIEAHRNNWTLAEVGQRVKRSPQALQDILKRGNPTLETLKQFAEALNISAEEMMSEVDPLEYGKMMIPKLVKI